MNSLYICYQSVLDPLTQSQVVAYLEGLTQDGYRVVLLTFEPTALEAEQERFWQGQMIARGIRWYWTRYHKRPSLPASLWDIVCGMTIGVRLVRRHDIKLVHARSHVPGVMALGVKRLTGVKLLFDIRGFKAEEQVDAGLWRTDSAVFSAMKIAERAITRAADGIVVLTTKAKDLLYSWYPEETAGKPIQVIPCCVDVGAYSVRRERGGDACVGIRFVYVGKLGGWYMVDEMLSFFEAATRSNPGARWDIWTQSDPATFLQEITHRGWTDRIMVGQTPMETLPEKLQQADVGLSFVRPSLSKRASSPTKVGEYLAAGLPVVSTAGIGDLDELLTWGNSLEETVGVLVHEHSDEGRREGVERLLNLLCDEGLAHRCRTIAEERLGLQQVGWSRYRKLYRELIPA